MSNKNSFSAAIIQGNSMLPEFREGDLVITRRCNDINPDDVIVFREPLADILVIHRVIRSEGFRFITKGDTNEHPDPSPLFREDISGKVWIKIPRIGMFIQSLKRRR